MLINPIPEFTNLLDFLTEEKDLKTEILSNIDYFTASSLLKQNQIALISERNFYVDLTNFKNGGLLDTTDSYKLFDANLNLLYIVQNHTGIFGRNTLDRELVKNNHNKIFFLEYPTLIGTNLLTLYVFNSNNEKDLIVNNPEPIQNIKSQLQLDISFIDYEGLIKVYFKQELITDENLLIKANNFQEIQISPNNKTISLFFEELSSILIKDKNGRNFYLKTFNRSLLNFINPLYLPVYYVKNIVEYKIKVEAFVSKNAITNIDFVQQPVFFKISLDQLRKSITLIKTKEKIFLTFTKPESSLAGNNLNLAGSITDNFTGGAISNSLLSFVQVFNPFITSRNALEAYAGSSSYFAGSPNLTTSYEEITYSEVTLDIFDPLVNFVGPLSFSSGLTNFLSDPAAASLTNIQIANLGETNVSAPITGSVRTLRENIAGFYKNIGILIVKSNYSNVPFFSTNQSNILAPGNSALSQDSSFYKKIPTAHLKLQLPSNYFGSANTNLGQLNTVGFNSNDNRVGYGFISSSPIDPTVTIRTVSNFPRWQENPAPMYFSNANLNSTTIKVPININRYFGNSGIELPTGNIINENIVSFFQPSANKLIELNSFSESSSEYPGDWTANRFEVINTPMLGYEKGTTVSSIPTVAGLLLPGESIHPTESIAHALRGTTSSNQIWSKAMVYPASSTPINISSTNNGALPLGALIQLNPNFTISNSLSLPARRILRAIQQYGWYITGIGPRSFDIDTSISAAEFEPYGGMNLVLTQIYSVLSTQPLFLVAPLVKRP
jgi:hypothetical protein